MLNLASRLRYSATFNLKCFVKVIALRTSNNRVDNMSILSTWLLWMIIAIAIVFALGYYLPRFSAYVLGPGFLLLGIIAFIKNHKLFFFFQSDGSIAGLIVPIIMWLGLITCCVLGIVLIMTGVIRMKPSAISKSQNLEPES